MIKRITRAKDLNEDERCAKHQEALARRLAKEEIKEASNTEEIAEEEEDDQEELPFQDILADQRRKYTTKQEFVYSIYSELVKNFVKEREGTYLRKMAMPKSVPNESAEEATIEIATDEVSEKVDATINKPETYKEIPKLCTPDERVKIKFVNGNSYIGRISRQKLEGEGLYRWRNGSQCTGEFEDNKIQGKGKLEWQDSGWYEGDFRDGYRHGRGTMVDRNYHLLYIGEWYKGHKHGKGFCRYKDGDSYDGDWIMDKREGVGNRVYPSGARYVGHWKDGFRHGIGTMAWPNGDLYRGEWKSGHPHGYGEYTWNGFFNNNLCWPQEVTYMGEWHEGTRDGKGQLSLNSMGGARYSGGWEKNKKHGYGTLIGNNGEVIDGDPLFENDVLLPFATTNNLSEVKNSRNNENTDVKDYHKSMAKPAKIPEARVTPVLKPEQCPPLWSYIDRLRETETTSATSSLISLISGKCGICEDKSSCRCLRRSQNKTSHDKTSRALSSSSSFDTISAASASTSGTQRSDRRKDSSSTEKLEVHTSDSKNVVNLEQEEYSTYNCITMHMPRIRKIYDVYAKIFCRNDAPKCRLSMSKLSLWQLWRDCGIHEKGMSLVEIDRCLAVNESILTEDPYCPFARIEIWQLIRALLEVSWHLYTKNREIDTDCYPGRLANGLDKFLLQDIYPNYGKSMGVLVGRERDLLPVYPVYELYLTIGKLHSARQLMMAVFTKKDESQNKLLCGSTSECLRESKNAVTIGEKLSYIPNPNRIDPLTKTSEDPSTAKLSQISAHSISALRELGTEEFLCVMSVICPAIKDPETSEIVNMDYQLTFLEFFEIFVEAGKKLVSKRRIKREADRAKIEVVETAAIVSNSRDRKMSRSTGRLSSSTGKSTKSRKKLVTKH